MLYFLVIIILNKRQMVLLILVVWWINLLLFMVVKISKKKMRGVQRELERIRRQEMTDENLAQQRELALEEEEMYWAQRSCIRWLCYGDRNTNYFQNRASVRRKKNRIDKLQDESGIW